MTGMFRPAPWNLLRASGIGAIVGAALALVTLVGDGASFSATYWIGYLIGGVVGGAVLGGLAAGVRNLVLGAR